jgi:hypothetical protein
LRRASLRGNCMFRKKSNGITGRYRDYSSSASYSPVHTPYRKRGISLFPILGVVSGIAFCILIILFMRSCSCDNRLPENPPKRAENRITPAAIETEKSTPVKKKTEQYRQKTAMPGPAAAVSEAKPANEQPVEPFVPKTIDMGTHVEIITSPKK